MQRSIFTLAVLLVVLAFNYTANNALCPIICTIVLVYSTSFRIFQEHTEYSQMKSTHTLRYNISLREKQTNNMEDWTINNINNGNNKHIQKDFLVSHRTSFLLHAFHFFLN